MEEIYQKHGKDHFVNIKSMYEEIVARANRDVIPYQLGEVNLE